MSIKQLFRRTKALVMGPLYAQVLFVIVAFTLMVVSSYLYVSYIEKEQLRKNVRDAIASTEANIKSDLLEPETMLGGISETIRDMILRGSSVDRVHEYILFINDYISSTADRRLMGVIGFYGVFDAYNGKFLTGKKGWELPEGYDPASRSWYRGAVEAAGEIAVTEPYIDIYTNEVSITFARRIFDDGGGPLGIVSLDIGLDRIRQRAVNTQFAENGYGFLMTGDMEIIAHPDPGMLGMMFSDVPSNIPVYMGELKQKGFISEVITTDYRGIESIVFIQRLQNGWYMGVVTPKDKYYQTTRDMAAMLVMLGGLLALILSVILFRIVADKEKSDKRTQIMFESMPLCANFWDGNFVNIDCNLESVRLFGVSSKQEYKNRFYELSPEYQPDGSLSSEKGNEYLRRALDEGYCRFEWMHRKLNGEPLPCEITLVRVRYQREFIVAGYTRDLREQKAMLREMQRAQIAEASNKAKSNFLAKMSHEIRTPMNAILGITEMQMQNKALPTESKEALGLIYDSGYLLLGIINDILDLSKIEAGKMELTPVNYDVPSLINDIVHLNVMRYDSKPIVFKLQVDENIPVTLFGDELRIKQILNNLLSNAFKYTDSGSVSLSVTAEYAWQEESDKVNLIFKVSDTGQGMTREQVNKLFNEYTRFNTEANRTTVGTGLGMAITKFLAQMMNGEIAVESEPGKGSVFTVRLPQGIVGTGVLGSEVADNLRQFRLGKASQMEKAPQIVREYMPYGRILIVDDVETNLYVAKGLMAPYGLSIETVLSGFEAIEKVKSGITYDVIFMDHFMPNMDGIEATEIIRGLGYTQPIIALTANALAGQAEMFMEHGFDGYISKPIDIRHLNAALNKLIRDKYPSETIDAARRLKNSLKKYSANDAQQPAVDPQLAEIFIRDAGKAAAVLEVFCAQQGAFEDEDIQNYIITVHSMKSALANIGETELSDFARKLEYAARERDTAVLSGDTPAFLNLLRALVEKIRPKDNSRGEAADAGEARAFLNEKLLDIQVACDESNKRAAKEALTELRQKTWPPQVTDLLSTIAGHLLHSEFEEVSHVVEDYVSSKGDNNA